MKYVCGKILYESVNSTSKIYFVSQKKIQFSERFLLLKRRCFQFMSHSSSKNQILLSNYLERKNERIVILPMIIKHNFVNFFHFLFEFILLLVQDRESLFVFFFPLCIIGFTFYGTKNDWIFYNCFLFDCEHSHIRLINVDISNVTVKKSISSHQQKVSYKFNIMLWFLLLIFDSSFSFSQFCLVIKRNFWWQVCVSREWCFRCCAFWRKVTVRVFS